MPRGCGNCGLLSAALLVPAIVLVAAENTTPESDAAARFPPTGPRLPVRSMGAALLSSAGLVLGIRGVEAVDIRHAGVRQGLSGSITLLHGMLLVASVVRLWR